MRKNKVHISPAPPVAGDQKSSFTQVLKELKKETEKKQSAAEAARVLCKICFREIAPKRVCGGHGGGGGGSDATSGTSEEKVTHGSQSLISQPDATIDEKNLVNNFISIVEDIDSQHQTDEEGFNPEVIAELITNKLLLIDNDREAMTLTIKLQCEPNSLSEEQRYELKKFMVAILKELNTYTEINHLSDDCVNLVEDKEGNVISLRITLPTLALYDAFTQRLTDNLLPAPNAKSQAAGEVKMTQDFAPNPLQIEPKPSSKDNIPMQEDVKRTEDAAVQETEISEQEMFNPSPFSIKMRPW